MLDDLFNEILPNGSFYHAKIHLELGKAYSFIIDKESAEEHLKKGKLILEAIFGSKHPV